MFLWRRDFHAPQTEFFEMCRIIGVEALTFGFDRGGEVECIEHLSADAIQVSAETNCVGIVMRRQVNDLKALKEINSSDNFETIHGRRRNCISYHQLQPTAPAPILMSQKVEFPDNCATLRHDKQKNPIVQI